MFLKNQQSKVNEFLKKSQKITNDGKEVKQLKTLYNLAEI